MEIVLHVGPHKTGTTSLQVALQRAFGTPRPGAIWYPPTEPPNTGHAVLAAQLLGLGAGSSQPDAGALEATVRRAREGGCQRLLLSAEDFSRACSDGRMPRLARIGAEDDVLLVVTLCPIGRRSVSLWQQFVQAGHDLPLEESWPHVRSFLYEQELIEQLLMAFPTSRLRIIMVDRNADPQELFNRFTSATGITLGIESKSRHILWNRSVSFEEAELIRSFTRGLGQLDITESERMEIRYAISRFFNDARWQKFACKIPILAPPVWREEVERRTTALLELLGRLQGERRVRIFGDIELLKDTGPWRADTEPAQTVAPHRLQLLLGAMLALAMENGQKANKELVASKERERQANEALVIAAGGVQQAEKMLATATERERQASETLRNIQASRFWRASRPVLRMINRLRQARKRLFR